mmetsp:Transcript_14450/g.41553  ORF Transcript_14450/g.41553 Transcript_14450/m.41553 type:complete len:314 (+) Transcript_14450:133-1074(+)
MLEQLDRSVLGHNLFLERRRSIELLAGSIVSLLAGTMHLASNTRVQTHIEISDTLGHHVIKYVCFIDQPHHSKSVPQIPLRLECQRVQTLVPQCVPDVAVFSAQLQNVLGGKFVHPPGIVRVAGVDRIPVLEEPVPVPEIFRHEPREWFPHDGRPKDGEGGIQRRPRRSVVMIRLGRWTILGYSVRSGKGVFEWMRQLTLENFHHLAINAAGQWLAALRVDRSVLLGRVRTEGRPPPMAAAAPNLLLTWIERPYGSLYVGNVVRVLLLFGAIICRRGRRSGYERPEPMHDLGREPVKFRSDRVVADVHLMTIR